jgi:Xaa-Pro dipeptidase
MHAQEAPARRHALQQVMAQHGLDAYLASTSESLLYFSGLAENGHERLLALVVKSDGQSGLICPALTAAQAERVGAEVWGSWRDGENPFALAAERLAGAKRVAVDSGFRADHLLALMAALPGVEFVAGDKIRAQVMRRKSEAELAALRRAGALADAAYAAVIPHVRAGITEVELVDRLHSAMKENGGSPTFGTACFGAASAEPHHHPGAAKLKPGQVILVDFGCSWEGYQSDITRMACLGEVGDKARQVHEVVWQAHHAGRAAANVGTPMKDIDGAGRQVIADAGWGEFFTHRLGHGLGLGLHEEPNVSPDEEFRLEAGCVFSIEPGIYLAGEFGVRIENIVTATPGGCQSLNAEPSRSLFRIDA